MSGIFISFFFTLSSASRIAINCRVYYYIYTLRSSLQNMPRTDIACASAYFSDSYLLFFRVCGMRFVDLFYTAVCMRVTAAIIELARNERGTLSYCQKTKRCSFVSWLYRNLEFSSNARYRRSSLSEFLENQMSLRIEKQWQQTKLECTRYWNLRNSKKQWNKV